MKRYYHMIVQRIADLDGTTRREYIDAKQGAAPPGWRCVGVCGFHDEPKEKGQKRRNDWLYR